MAHNSTNHVLLKCAPTEIFQGETPHSALDLKFANPIRVANHLSDISKMPDEINKNYKQKVPNIVTAYHKVKTYCDRTASAQPLVVNKLLFLLNAQYDDQSSKQHFKSFQWEGPNKVIKILSKSIVRKLGTRKTRCVNCMRLQPFVPHKIEDTQVNQKDLYPNDNAVEDTDIFDENLPAT